MQKSGPTLADQAPKPQTQFASFAMGTVIILHNCDDYNPGLLYLSHPAKCFSLSSAGAPKAVTCVAQEVNTAH